MFTTLIVQPIFNVLALILSIIPSHNFGMAIIIFTILTRLALYPLLKKQLRHTKAMRELQPELKKIKQKTKGDKQQEALLTMELYKEREIKPMAYLGLMVVQLVIFLALFSGLNRVVKDPTQLYEFSYGPIQNTEYMQSIKEDVNNFDDTLFGVVDLSRSAIEDGTIYFPALLLVLGSSIVQYAQIRQTMPRDKDARRLRDILRDANKGKEADSSEMTAAMGRNMATIMPIIIFVLTISFPAALPLYWFVGGLIAYMQQAYLLRQDEFAMTKATVVAKKPLHTIDIETTPKKAKHTTTTTDSGVKVTTYTAGGTKPTQSKPSSSKKRRKR